MSVLPGSPAELTTRASGLLSSASIISDVIDELRAIKRDDEGKSLQALYEQNAEVAGQLERIQPRYQNTATAISEYAVVLTAAHRTAEDADDDLATAQTQQRSAQQRVANAQDAVDAADDPDPSLDSRLRNAQISAASAQDAVDDAQARIDQARRDMEDAAEQAIRLIDSAIDSTNESWFDKVGEFFSDLGDFLADIFEWIGEFLEGVLDLLQRIAATIVAILSTLLVFLAVLAVAALFGAIVLLAAGLVLVALAGFLIWSIASDVSKPTPKVDTFDPYAGRDDTRPPAPTLENVLDGTAEVDLRGGETDSVIKITKVLGPDGWYYTVTLPSTQEWFSRLGDKGAVNDLDSNLALMLTPLLQTQYERAVLQAMHDAGITADDPVMLVGFSQGGIMAGHIAAYTSDFNVQAVVVSGAPIDHMPIPDSIDVVSMQHVGDPVHELDELVSPSGVPDHGPNWTTISVEPTDPNPIPLLGVDVDAHNAVKYSETYVDHLDEIQANHPGLENFFNEDGLVDIDYYHWTE